MTNYWILPLWLTIHSPLLCGLLLAHCQYLHRFNIVIQHHSIANSFSFSFHFHFFAVNFIFQTSVVLMLIGWTLERPQQFKLFKFRDFGIFQFSESSDQWERVIRKKINTINEWRNFKIRKNEFILRKIFVCFTRRLIK